MNCPTCNRHYTHAAALQRHEQAEHGRHDRYEVWVTLAGNTASRRFYRSYRSSAAAKAQARRLTGYGHVGIVVAK